jgi:chromosome segregation ATPase
VVEYLLLFCIGFLAAVLFALLVAPSIWRRAVYLTEKRVRATVPLSLEEVRAEKDKLRAEFAMAQRRQEMRIEELVAKTARLLASNASREEDVLKLTEDNAGKVRNIEKLEAELATLRAEYAAQGEELDSCIADLRAAETQIESKAMEIERLERELTEASLSASNFQVELAASETQLERVREQLRETRDHLRVSDDKAKNLASELKLAIDASTATSKRLAETEDKLEKVTAELITLEEKLERREAELKRLQDRAKEEKKLLGQAERNLEAAAKQSQRMEKEFEQLAGLFDGFDDRKPVRGEMKKMVSRLIGERNSLMRQLSDATGEREKLKSDIDLLSRQLSDIGGAGQAGTADLREKIGDIAARVVHMTAVLEGSQSPVYEVLRKSDPDKEGAANGNAMPSLADRIRSLQKAPAARP